MIVSPEFLFVRMAQKLSFHAAVRLGYELCGTYIVRPDEHAKNEREPLSSIAKLRRFAEHAEAIRGRRKALVALKYVVEGSNSPMETALAMLLCLPCHYGGFGLPKPKMNYSIKLGKEQSRSTGRGEYRCDLYWKESAFALEYYGREWHTGASQVAYDARRQSDLQAQGIEVAVVTHEQLETPDLVEELAKKVARKVGSRIRKPTVGCACARVELHRYLIGTKLQRFEA